MSAIILEDTFKDNSLDTSKWTESANAGSLVAEQNNQLELISNSNISAFIRSNIAVSPKNTQLILKVTQHCTDAGFKLCPTVVENHQWDVYSELNWYSLQCVGSTKLSPNVKDGGSSAQVGGDSPTLSTPYWIRMRIDNTTIYFDYSKKTTKPNRDNDWINISSELWDMGTGIDQAQYCYITAYNTPSTGEPHVSDFSWEIYPSPTLKFENSGHLRFTGGNNQLQFLNV